MRWLLKEELIAHVKGDALKASCGHLNHGACLPDGPDNPPGIHVRLDGNHPPLDVDKYDVKRKAHADGVNRPAGRQN